MNLPALSVSQTNQNPILIIDKRGDIGKALANELKEESLVVLVSKNRVEQEENVVHVPFSKATPTIPDNIFSHIFLIDEDLELSRSTVEKFSKIAKKQNAEFIVAFSTKNASSEFINSVLELYQKTKVIIFGDIFAKDFIYDQDLYVNKFIYQAKHFNKISIPGDGMAESSPVFFNDVVYKILEIVFGDDAKERIYYVFPKQKTTLLTLAHIFLKKHPYIKVDFFKVKRRQEKEFVPPFGGKFVLEDHYNIEEKINKIDLEKLESQKSLVSPKTRFDKKRFRLLFAELFYFLFILLILPPIFTYVFFYTGNLFLNLAKANIVISNYSLARGASFFASKSLDASAFSLSLLENEIGLLGQRVDFSSLRQNIYMGEMNSSVTISLIDSSYTVKDVLSGKTKYSPSDIKGVIAKIKDALFNYQKSYLENSRDLKNYTDAINFVSNTIDYWPRVLGFEGKKNYVLVFADNTKLNPGGGFINSYSFLTLDKGRVYNFKINKPPIDDNSQQSEYALRRYMGLKSQSFSESNFNVDSNISSQSILEILKQKNQSADGVIFVDLYFTKNLLSLVGPVDVKDYGVSVTSQNLFALSQSREDNYTDNTGTRKDFLFSFYNALAKKLSKEDFSDFSFLKLISEATYQKHIAFTFSDPAENADFLLNGLSSSLTDLRVNSSESINDYVGISEADLGINKASNYITRKAWQKVEISEEGDLTENLTLLFKNSADENIVNGGDYKNYLRMVLPKDSEVSSIQINGKEQKIVTAVIDPKIYEKKGFVPPKGLEVERYNQEDKTVVGFLINVPSNNSTEVKIQYTFPQRLFAQSNIFSYDLKIFKQPGIDTYPYSLSVTLPKNFKLKNSSDALDMQISRDREVRLTFARE